jgi:hemoglobin
MPEQPPELPQTMNQALSRGSHPHMNAPRTRPTPPEPELPVDHPLVDRAFIATLVRTFYGRVRADPRLGPIFAAEIADHWEPHLEKMTDFWCAVILKNGAYSGRPVPAHVRLKGVLEEDFDIWLDHFRATASELCPAPLAAVFVERAERIARSLKLAMFFTLAPDPQRPPRF